MNKHIAKLGMALALTATLSSSALAADGDHRLTFHSVECNSPELMQFFRMATEGNYYINLEGEEGDPTWALEWAASNSAYCNLRIEVVPGNNVTYSFTDLEGNPVKPMLGNATATLENKSTTLSFNADKCPDMNVSFFVEPTPMDATLSLNIIGDPARVRLSMANNRLIKNLVEGYNSVPFNLKTESRVYLTCDLDPDDSFVNDGFFSLVTLDGNEMTPSKTYAGDSGSMPSVGGGTVEQRDTYTYIINVKDGSALDVNTVFEGDPCLITIKTSQVEATEFIQSVKVNGQEVTDWVGGFVVNPGDFVYVRGNERDYNVTVTRVNGQATNVPTPMLGRLILENTEFYFMATKYNRPYNFTAYATEGTTWRILTSRNQAWTIPSGYSRIDFANSDLPFILLPSEVSPEATFSDDAQPYVFVNEKPLAFDEEQGGFYLRGMVDETLVKCIISDEEPGIFAVSYAFDDDNTTVPQVVRDRYIAVSDFDKGHNSVEGTPIEVILPEGAVEGNTFGVLVNGVAIEPREDGNFEFNVIEPSVVKFRGRIDQTGLDAIVAEGMDDSSNAWYTVQGLRLKGQPTRPGVYIDSKGNKRVVVTAK